VSTAAEFNARYPIGTPVVAYPGCRPEDRPSTVKRLITRTRSEAWNLASGAPVVMVDGHAGGIALTHIDPFPVWDSVVQRDRGPGPEEAACPRSHRRLTSQRV
jgi:hypothetical protein